MRPVALSSTLKRVRRRRGLARSGDAAFVAVAAAGVTAAVATPLGFGPIVPAIAGLTGFLAMWRPAPSLADTAAWLDRRHDLHDLLASAWTTRGQTGEWPAALHALADATAAGLPATHKMARFSPRHHACVLAGGVAVVLAGRLMSPVPIVHDPADSPSSRIALADRSGNTARPQTAAAITRAPDTAESPAPRPAPAPADPAARPSPRPGGPGDAANGPGRSDSNRAPAVPTPASPDRPPPTAPAVGPGPAGPAGSGRPAGTTDERSPAGGRVESEMAADPADAAAPSRNVPTPAPTGDIRAKPVPAAYRDLVRDYFAR